MVITSHVHLSQGYTLCTIPNTCIVTRSRALRSCSPCADLQGFTSGTPMFVRNSNKNGLLEQSSATRHPHTNRRVLAYCISLVIFLVPFAHTRTCFAQEAKGMNCVSKYCSQELSKCISDPKCARGLGCFINCSTIDILKNPTVKMKEEGVCQVRCMDLYQNSNLDDFTECTLTKNCCYEPIKSDER